MVVANNWYVDWFNSPYFYQLYSSKNEQVAGPFISKMTSHLGITPGSYILDAGCGIGRQSGLLATYGYDVTGIDPSFYSINEAKIAESDNLHFFQHDMRLPFWVNYFHYAFNLFASFGYFKTEREHYNGIRTIANSLKPGGSLVLDYLNVHYSEDNLVHKSENDIGGVNFYITKWYDETHFYKKIVVEDEQLKEPLTFYEKLAKFNLGDFNDMLAFHHLQVQEVFGDYELGSFDVKKSPRLILTAKKST